MGEPWEIDELDAQDRVARAKDAAIEFEAVKTFMKQSPAGVAITFNMPPDRVPIELITAHIGQRFLVVAVPIDTDEQPKKIARAKHDPSSIVARAGILCGDQKFQSWLCSQGLADELDTEAAAYAVREFCGIASRSELASNADAARRFRQMADAFQRNLPL